MSGEQDQRRLLLGAFGDPGHAFPLIALGEALVARGHQVTLQTWRRWREPVERAGMRFAAAPEYQVFPTRERPLKPYAAAVRAAKDTRPLIADARPDAVVADILTPAVALAAEAEGVPWATLVPHVFPPAGAGFPPYSVGARLPRSGLGRALWRAMERPVGAGLRRGRDELNGARARLGLQALAEVHGGISRALCLVGTFPQLEYPRVWPAGAHVVGPLLWEPPTGDVELPPGDDPLVLVAPSTSQDPAHRLLRAAVAGLGDLPVRVLATQNGRPLRAPITVPANTRLVDWASYSRTMPHCAVVVCHGGHGTIVRALANGCSVVAAPVSGDMNENAARADWAGAGIRLPWRFLSPRTLRLAVERALGEPRLHAAAAELAAWSRRNSGAERAAELVERFVTWGGASDPGKESRDNGGP
jgi:UDP:flavonoid glycosyltransferase YjiC (YdhE family)